jgi:hypothetical protein
MSGPASLSGALPDGPANGLAAIADDLVDNPTRVHVAIILLDTVKITQRVDDGTRVATVRVRRIEPIRDPGDAATMRRLLQREFERRTGQVVLPFDLETDVRTAMDGLDPDPDAP